VLDPFRTPVVAMMSRHWLPLAALLLLPAAAPAQTTATWLGGTGNWTTSPLWTTNPLFPNNGNGGQTFTAVVNSGAVTVNQNIAVTGLVNGGGTVTVGNGNTFSTLSTLAVTGGTLTTSGSGSVVSLGTANLTAGVLAPAAGGSVTLAGAFNWTGGRLGGAGTTTLAGAGVASGGSGRLLGGVVTIANGGSLAVTGGNLMTDASGAGVTVNSGGVFDLRSDGVVLANNFTGTLTSSGTLRRSGSTGIAQVDWVVGSSGRIDSQTGTLRLTNGGTLIGTHTGTGVLELTAGTFTTGNAATFASSGNLTVNGGTFTTAGNGAINSTGAVLLSAGVLAPATGGSVTLGGGFTWTGGTLGGAGTTTVSGSATGGGVKLLGGDVTVGTLTVTGGSLMANASGADIFVAGAGLLDLRSDGVVLSNNFTGGLANSGTLRRSGSTGIAQVDWVVGSSGRIDSQTGTLRLTNGGTLIGTHTGAGVLELSGGTFGIPSSVNLSSSGNVLISGGVVVANGNWITTSTGTLTLSAGRLQAHSGENVFLDGSFTWTGGALGVAGGITVINGTGVASGGGSREVGGLVNVGSGGSLAVTGGTITANTAAVQVLGGGLLDLRSDGVVLSNNTVGNLTNAGTVRRSVSGGLAQVDWVVNSSGAIDSQTGTLRFANGGSLSGTHTGAGVLELAGGTFTTATGTTFSTSGNLTVAGGTFTTAGSGAVTSTGSVTLSAGTLAPATGGGVTLAGAFAWTGGRLGGAGTTTLAGAGVASGGVGREVGGVVTIANGGSLAVTGGNLTANASGAGVTVNAGGVFDLRSDGVVLANNFTGTLTNSGTLRRSGSTGVAQVNWTVTNAAGGLIDVQTGTLTVGGVIPNAGTVRVASGATFQGNIANGATGVVRGAGTVTGNVNLNTAGGMIEAGEGTSDPNLTVTNGLTMAADSKYRVTLFGTGANDISRVNVTGGTTSIATGADLDLNLSGLDAAQAQALRDAVGVGNSRDYVVLAATGTIGGGGFTAGNFTITDTGHFVPGEWSLANGGAGGSTVVLRFTPVPEPAGLLAVAAVAVAAGVVCRRKVKGGKAS
jgi:fibronectin-binding autotransporter adhesin